MKNLLNEVICEAIKSRKIISFIYEGGGRYVEPYCYGILKNGNEALRGYQIKGYSSSGKIFGWKLFHISKMKGIKIENEKFTEIRPRYNPNDSAMHKIFCNV